MWLGQDFDVYDYNLLEIKRRIYASKKGYHARANIESYAMYTAIGNIFGKGEFKYPYNTDKKKPVAGSRLATVEENQEILNDVFSIMDDYFEQKKKRKEAGSKK